MSLNVVIQIDNVSKQYRLGEVSTGSLHHDINRWWHRLRGKEDPYLSITGENIRTRRRERKTAHSTLLRNSASSAVSEPSACEEYVWALKDITFEVREGEVLGIIGRNGAGKSTLLKILSRVTAPTLGEIRVKGRIASLLEVGTGFHQDLTGRENIYLNGAVLGMTRQEISRKLDEIVEFSGCAAYLDTPVKRYSSGMVVRLGFAVAAHLEPEILIVDEVLAVGDAEFQKRCIGKMSEVASQGRTVLFVSHNMAAVEKLCSRALLLDAGGVKLGGSPEACIARYLQDARSLVGDAYKDMSQGAVRIQDFSVIHAGQSVSEVFLDDNALVFSVTVETQRALKKFAIHIGVYTEWDALVCLCRSDDCNDFDLSPGCHDICCEVGTIPLAAGSYYCHIVLYENAQLLGSGVRHLQFRVVSGTVAVARGRNVHPLLAPTVKWSKDHDLQR